MDVDGPVADSEIRLVSLAPGPCPCPKESRYSVDLPCACAKAMENWQRRLAHCTPATSLSHVRSDARGRFELPLAKGGNALEVESARGMRWMPLPQTTADVVLDLQASAKPRVRFSRPSKEPGRDLPDLRAGLMFEDGHCVPLVHEQDVWAPATSVPVDPNRDLILVVDGPGLAPAAHRIFHSRESELTLSTRSFTSIVGNCSYSADSGRKKDMANATVTWESPFHSPMRMIADGNGNFTWKNVPDQEATITCKRAGRSTTRWFYRPDQGLSIYILTQSLEERTSRRCDSGLTVLDSRGRPVAAAEVTLWGSDPYEKGGGGSSSRGWETDRRGRVCTDELLDGGFVLVRAPAALGGWCAGEKGWYQKRWRRSSGQSQMIQVPLKMRSFRRSGWRGRVVSAEGFPVADAYVVPLSLWLGSCSVSVGDGRTTAADGTFALPSRPHGKYTLRVHHRWYPDREFEVNLPSPPQDLVLERGGTWSGRVLDPDGAVLSPCQIWAKKNDQIVGMGGGDFSNAFTLKALPAGKMELDVGLVEHAKLGRRYLKLEVEFQPQEQRHQDIHWPAGATIAGQVVSEKTGKPIANVYVVALPKGAHELQNQDHPGSVTMRTDSEGRFVFRHLAPGTWTVQVFGKAKAAREVTTGDTQVRLVVP